jgi:hypothetical protein
MAVKRRVFIACARLSLLLMVVAGCRLPSGALDGPLAVPLRIDATAENVQVDAPGWFAPETNIYLCPTEPPELPEPGPARIGWSPGSSCHDYGRVATPNGLTATLPVGAFTDAERSAFEGASDWFLFIVKVDGERASAAIRSSFASPIRSGT